MKRKIMFHSMMIDELCYIFSVFRIILLGRQKYIQVVPVFANQIFLPLHKYFFKYIKQEITLYKSYIRDLKKNIVHRCISLVFFTNKAFK